MNILNQQSNKQNTDNNSKASHPILRPILLDCGLITQARAVASCSKTYAPSSLGQWTCIRPRMEC